jgi:hypothetical protein
VSTELRAPFCLDVALFWCFVFCVVVEVEGEEAIGLYEQTPAATAAETTW